ncbi:SurA N-terminal domain-containing protein [Candidatus Ruminimicrobiellum ovillum]|uniref:SurA N-terminal domain-containing protein n=1 Tax=Candidatus Ruminimicrobiellum ovillum TaxID=1947927 RepID=UPI003559A2B6
MMNFFRKHKVAIILVILIGFFGGTFIAGFGVSTFGNSASSFDTVAVINGKKIPYKYYYSLYNSTLGSLRQSGQELTDELIKLTQNQILRTLVQDELIWQQTKKYGITVSDNELAQDIQSYPYFLNANEQFDSRNYYQFLNNLRMSPKDFESLRRKQIAANKLQLLVASATQVTKSEMESLGSSNIPELTQIKANEILNDWFDTVKKNSKIEILLDDNRA